MNNLNIEITWEQIQIWIGEHTTALMAGVITLAIFYIVKRYLYLVIRKFDTREMVDAVADRIESLSWATGIITAIYIGVKLSPQVNATINFIADGIFMLTWIWQIMQLAFRLVDYLVERYSHRENMKANSTAYRFLGRTAKIIVFLLAGLTIIGSLGFDISSLIAGLGIGGIAVALAVQAVLGDFISSFSIVTDKPFEVGDFIIVDKYMGTVKKIGIKSTRIRSLSGELLVMPNTELVKSTVKNYGDIQKRRSEHTLGVEYSTTNKLLKEIPELVITAAQKVDLVIDDSVRCHLVQYADFSINFELAFFVDTENFRTYLDAQQEVLMNIKHEFDQKKISFAFPTQQIISTESS